MASTNYTVGSGSKKMIMKGGLDTGYVISGSSTIKESGKGHSIDWMFN